MLKRPLAAIAAVLSVFLLAACGEDEAGAEEAANAVECDFAAAGEPARDVEPPESAGPAPGEVTATLATSAGELTATLDGDAAPCTVRSFVSLAEQDYFDDTACHRLTTQGIYVLQCGDPTASGTGGPGYTIPDEVDGSETYPAGTLAMANTGQPDSGGSQFFVVHEDTELPATYTVFGSLDDASLETVREIAAQGTANGAPDGPPAQEVVIGDVRIG